MNRPQAYICLSILYPRPFTPQPSRLSQSTSFRRPESCIKLPMATYFTYGNACFNVILSNQLPSYHHYLLCAFSPFPLQSITDFEKKGRGQVEDQTNLLQIHAASFFFFFGLHCMACRILVLQPGSECTVKSAES